MVKLRPIDIFNLLRDSAVAFGEDKAPRLAAAIAYYAMFSIAPLLLLAVAVAGQFLSSDQVTNQLFGPDGFITQNLNESAAASLKAAMESNRLQRGATFASTIGFVTLFMGATGLFVQLQDALNSMWGADPPPPQGILQQARTRLTSFALILFVGVLLIGFLALNTLTQQLGAKLGVPPIVIRMGTLVLSLILMTPVFAFIYKFLPSVKLEWREVLFGGAFTATLFTIGQVLIGLYLGHAAPGSAFGAAGTLLVLLLWVYYSAMIFFFGAEVTWMYSQKFGSKAGGAVNVDKKEALAARGVDIDITPSAQEVAARAVSRLPRFRNPWRKVNEPIRVKTYEPEPVVPTVSAAIWNAVRALMAIPAVMALNLVGWKGSKPTQPSKR